MAKELENAREYKEEEKGDHQQQEEPEAGSVLYITGVILAVIGFALTIFSIQIIRDLFSARLTVRVPMLVSGIVALAGGLVALFIGYRTRVIWSLSIGFGIVLFVFGFFGVYTISGPFDNYIAYLVGTSLAT